MAAKDDACESVARDRLRSVGSAKEIQQTGELAFVMRRIDSIAHPYRGALIASHPAPLTLTEIGSDRHAIARQEKLASIPQPAGEQ